MRKTPQSEINRSLTSQESPRILWNAKVQPLIQNRPASAPNLRQVNLGYAFPSHFLEIHFYYYPSI
jgi:hypothetical protein